MWVLSLRHSFSSYPTYIYICHMCVFVPVLPDHHWKCNTKPSFLVQTNKRQLIVVLIISQNCQHIHTRALPPLKAQLHLLHTYIFSKTPNKKLFVHIIYSKKRYSLTKTPPPNTQPRLLQNTHTFLRRANKKWQFICSILLNLIIFRKPG